MKIEDAEAVFDELESFFVASAPKVKKGVVKKVTFNCFKAFKKGQYVRVVHRKKPYIGRYVRLEKDSGRAWHVVEFAGNYVDVLKDNMIFPVEGLTEKRT
jgi:hypothetical protein